MIPDSESLKSIAIFNASRHITLLYKEFLTMLELIRDDRYNINDETYSVLRKRILDAGNSTIREVSDQLDKFKFSI
jgi:hypothetical protein